MQVTINLKVMTATVTTAPVPARTRWLLEAPVTSTLLALAVPNVLVMTRIASWPAPPAPA